MGITKSLGQKEQFDKFYTKVEVAKQCITFISDFNSYDCIIEPSAGNGSFSNQIQNCFCYDISPENNNIQKADWFKLDKNQFKQYKNILVIGNPPFGKQCNLAINFFNESAKIANTIAFILPLSFKKRSIQNKLNLYFYCEKEFILNKNSFLLNGKEYDVPCVFQIWNKKNIQREIQKNISNTKLFDFVSKNNADFRIQRVGGNAGKASFDLNFSEQSNYFIKNKTKLSNQDFVNLINNLTFDEIKYTVGPKSLSKTELIITLEKFFKEKNYDLE